MSGLETRPPYTHIAFIVFSSQTFHEVKEEN